MQKQFITISTSSFLKAVLILVIIGLVYLIWDILLLFFVALLLAALIMPLADWASAKKIPRGLTVFLVYLFALSLVVGVVALLVPPIINQITQVFGNFDLYKDKTIGFLSWAKDLAVHYKVWDPVSKIIPSTLADGVGTAQKVVGTVFGFLGGIGSLVLVLVMAFYIVAEENSFKKLVCYFTPPEYQPYFGSLWHRIKEKLGYWLRGQLLLDIIVGATSYIGLLIIGVPYALLLGLLAGIFETVPYAGPIFSAVLAIALMAVLSVVWSEILAWRGKQVKK